MYRGKDQGISGTEELYRLRGFATPAYAVQVTELVTRKGIIVARRGARREIFFLPFVLQLWGGKRGCT